VGIAHRFGRLASIPSLVSHLELGNQHIMVTVQIWLKRCAIPIKGISIEESEMNRKNKMITRTILLFLQEYKLSELTDDLQILIFYEIGKKIHSVHFGRS
jgi:hypothetical protein